MQVDFQSEKYNKLSKILVIVFMALTFLSTLMPDEFVLGIRELHSVYGDDFRLNAFQMLMRWLHLVAFLILPIAVFFNRNTFKKMALYFCLPVTLVFACMFGEMLPYFTSEKGTGICDIRYLSPAIEAFMKNGVFRGFLFFAIILLELAVIALVFLRDTSVWKFKKSDVWKFIVLLICCIFSIMPVYAPEGIFNTWTDVTFTFGSVTHIGWLLGMIAEVTVLTLIFRKRSYEDKYILVFILALSLLLQFNQLFSSLGELTCKRMPFQLCNIAAYTIFVSVASKKRGLFLFNILINVAGGIIAAIVMDVENNGILNKANIHYIVEHNNVIVVPLLCLILGIFKPIQMKDFKSFVLYFTGYYLFVFVLGTTFNAIYKATGSNFFYCNYLFLFDQETAARLIGFAGALFNVKLQLGAVTIYPVIQPIIYLAFFAIGTGMFFLLKTCIKEKVPAPSAESGAEIEPLLSVETAVTETENETEQVLE